LVSLLRESSNFILKKTKALNLYFDLLGLCALDHPKGIEGIERIEGIEGIEGIDRSMLLY
jgi:hypothetical protein